MNGAPKPISSMKLAYVLLQTEGKFYAATQRAIRGDMSEHQRRQFAAELREIADELERPTAQVINPDIGPAAPEASQVWPEVVDALRTIHLLSGVGAITLLEKAKTAADLHILLMNTAGQLVEAARCTAENAEAVRETDGNDT